MGPHLGLGFVDTGLRQVQLELADRVELLQTQVGLQRLLCPLELGLRLLKLGLLQ